MIVVNSIKKFFIVILFAPSICIAEINSVNAKFPAKPSLVPNVLLGVKRSNWKTFGLSCKLLDETITQYRKDDYWGHFGGDIEGKQDWYDCLKDIKKTQEALRLFRELRPKLLTCRDKIQKHTGKRFPLFTLNYALHKNQHGNYKFNNNTLYAIDINSTYRILQLLPSGVGLFCDTDDKWMPILLIPPKNVVLQENSYINQQVDYYSYDGIKTYTNTDGFKKQAFVFKGYRDQEFRRLWIQSVEALQQFKNANVKGM